MILTPRTLWYSLEKYAQRFLDLEPSYYSDTGSNKYQMPLQYFTPLDQWVLVEAPEIQKTLLVWHGVPAREIIQVTIKFKRRPLFYQIVFVYPCVVLYLLSAVTFFIPADSGEKVSFAVTILLTEIVTYGTLVDILPASSHNVPYLIYLIACITFHLTWTCVTAVMG